MLLHIGVEYALLFQVMGHCVLRQKWSLKANFGPNPFALCVGLIGRVVAASPTTELRTEICALNLLKVPDLAPSLVTDRAGNIDFELQDRHFSSTRPFIAFNALKKSDFPGARLRELSCAGTIGRA
jgi:hypothetical protein